MASFLGTGWGFPPTFKKSIRDVELVSDVADIKSSLEILFSTALGERIMRPEFGSDLTALVYEPMNSATEAYIRTIVEQAITLYEPRIELEELRLDKDHEAGTFTLSVDYYIPTINSKDNLVYPFYLSEGVNA